MTQDYPILTIVGDVDGSGDDETAIFEFKSADVRPLNRTGFLFRSGEGGIISTLVSRVTGENGEETIVSGDDTLAFEFEFDAWEDSDAQWGTTSKKKAIETSATGQSATTQLCVILRYIVEVGIDSGSPAFFQWGEFSSGRYGASDGLYEGIPCAVEQPQLNRVRDKSSSFSATFTVVAVRDVTDLTNHDTSRTG